MVTNVGAHIYMNLRCCVQLLYEYNKYQLVGWIYRVIENLFASVSSPIYRSKTRTSSTDNGGTRFDDRNTRQDLQRVRYEIRLKRCARACSDNCCEHNYVTS